MAIVIVFQEINIKIPSTKYLFSILSCMQINVYNSDVCSLYKSICSVWIKRIVFEIFLGVRNNNKNALFLLNKYYSNKKQYVHNIPNTIHRHLVANKIENYELN